MFSQLVKESDAMIYDPMSGALYGDDGTFLKTVYCPMTIRLDELQVLSPESPDRKCSACGDTVHSLDNLSDVDVKKLVEEKPNACVFATSQAKNVVILKQIGRATDAPDDSVRIKTARNLETMNDAQKRGFRLVFKDTGVDNEFGEFKFQLTQHSETGELHWSGDFRDLASEGVGGWKLVRGFTYVRPDKPFPIAAYLIPKDLPIGTPVYVEDLIQDVERVIWNQGDSVRVTSITGAWNGHDIDLDDQGLDIPILMG